MTRDEVIKTVVEVLGTGNALTFEDRLGSTKGWDSLAHIEIVAKLEAASGKRLSTEDAIFAETVADLVELFGSE